MSKRKLIAKGLVTLSLFTQHFAWAQTTTTVKRPPQFVMFAFDGSYNNEVWQYSRDYTKLRKDAGVDTRFTFFINPVYFLSPENKTFYQPPGQRLILDGAGNEVATKNRGSAIGWGDDRRDISDRIDQMNAAYREGHEIGSHAVGHFDGGFRNKKWDLRWSEADWKSEFTQFYAILDRVFDLNGISKKESKGLLFRNEITGFRAPVLGVSPGLWPNLPKFGIQYDTSKLNFVNYWPQRNEFGTWNFPLAEVPEPGGARKWISMDYNFCVRDSARVLKEEPQTMQIMKRDKNGNTVKANKARDCLNEVSTAQKAQVKANMLSIYRSYFNNNYYGNRAPVHIGHHFSKWMSGAYMEAFFEFANEVCSKPEVKCGTYNELQAFMEKSSASEIEAYRKGTFAKLPRPKSASVARHLDLKIDMTSDANFMNISLAGRDAQMAGLKKFVTVGDVTKEIDGTIDLKDIREVSEAGQDALVRISVENRMNKEIATATYTVKAVGTQNEVVDSENVEGRWEQGHMAEAHRDDVDFTKGH
ncbi:hypothetical protein AB1A81_04575 [Bdellovibrio bacteriovorus]|uniref:Putative secreted protein n=1 Tax=Bdellovibrio bacteriovorus (strain ATCC 15356 / DSM 50701 / NCIMB 9529 / HD100) TaxID=264462 RepID=Q6MP71_BDEBA|nr:secreted protein [Bdellovibrio bacteriovorus]CAE78927.1 putative secreted protein [Bdellovibrio bacteriovorus HD100]